MRKMNPKAVVFDSDDCLVAFMQGLCDLHNKLYGTCVTPTDITEYDMNKAHMVDINGNKVEGAELMQTFRDHEDHGLYASLDPLPSVERALKYINTLGYKIFVLTARAEKYRIETEMNFMKFNLKYDEVIFAESKDKAKAIRKLSKEYNIVCFADDKASTVSDVNENTKVKQVYLISQKHNENYEVDDEIIRVPSVFDIVRHLPDLN
jgi:uncharacterized HAD superfamily protein